MIDEGVEGGGSSLGGKRTGSGRGCVNAEQIGQEVDRVVSARLQTQVVEVLQRDMVHGHDFLSGQMLLLFEMMGGQIPSQDDPGCEVIMEQRLTMCQRFDALVAGFTEILNDQRQRCEDTEKRCGINDVAIGSISRSLEFLGQEICLDMKRRRAFEEGVIRCLTVERDRMNKLVENQLLYTNEALGRQVTVSERNREIGVIVQRMGDTLHGCYRDDPANRAGPGGL